MTGRHGNKGIVACLITFFQMPYLPNGNFVEIVFNSLGIPSRINVGQVYEALLGFSGFFLGETYLLPSFCKKNKIEISYRRIIFEKTCPLLPSLLVARAT